MSEALDAARSALHGETAWVVGGAVRDRMLGRSVEDVDLIVTGPAKRLARRLAAQVGGPSFELSAQFGAWRVIGPGKRWQADLTPLQGETLHEDLRLRDFTVNAIAEPLEGGSLEDPFGGVGDLRARRLKMVSDQSFVSDPLRVLRLARLGCVLGLEPDEATLNTARASARALVAVSGERIFAELKRLVGSPHVLRGIELMDAAGATEHVLPELHAMRDVEQNRYHHRDVHGHTLEVLTGVIELQADPAPMVGDATAGAVRDLLAEPLADELTRGDALRFGALLHDAAKPATRAEGPEGRVTFMDHDRLGAEMTRTACERWRTSERLRSHLAALARHHLRLGFLVHRTPLSRRDQYAYLRACEPVQADVTLLSMADRLATRGRKHEDAISAHMALARGLLAEALAWRAAQPVVPLVRGEELAQALGIEPGPQLGRLLEEIATARFAGEVATTAEAIEHARRVAAQL